MIQLATFLFAFLISTFIVVGILLALQALIGLCMMFFDRMKQSRVEPLKTVKAPVFPTKRARPF